MENIFMNYLRIADSSGGIFTGMALTFIFLVVLLGIGLYIYHALAWQAIGKKQKYKRPWLAWIPFANVSMIFEMGGFHWAWVFLFLIPFLGWAAIIILLTISMWRVFEKASYPGWLSLSYVLCMIPWMGFLFGAVYIIVIGLIAWEKTKVSKSVTVRKVRRK